MADSPQGITKEAFVSLKHPLQRRRFALALFFALILFPLIGIALAAGTVVLIVPLFAFLLWMSARVLFARFMGNLILVSELNYPRIHQIGEELKTTIGYAKTVNVFVLEEGSFNAYLLKFFFYRRAVFLTSELLEAGVTDEEVRWLIGRFIGYLRARRQAGFWGWTIRSAQFLLVFNPFLLPYERALVYSGDRIALAVIDGDISSAISAMQKLLVGRQLGYSVNPSGIIDQHRRVKGSFFAFLARVGSGFPHTTARYVDLVTFAQERYPEQYARFDAENPGLPADLRQLAALPKVKGSGGGDRVWPSLVAAIVFLGLLGLLTWKAIVPLVQRANASRETSADTSTVVVPPMEEQSQTASSSSVAAAAEAAATAASAAEEAGAAQPPPDSNASMAQTPRYVSDAGRFSVLFPGPPTPNARRTALSGSDSVTLHQVSLARENASYLVIYGDYPVKYVSGDPQAVLGIMRDGSVKALKGTLAGDGPVELHGVPGRVFKFTDKDGSTFIAADFLDGQRIYQVMAMAGRGAPTSQAEAFLNSFRIR